VLLIDFASIRFKALRREARLSGEPPEAGGCSMHEDLLDSLGIRPVNSGAATGTWIDTRGPELVSQDPAREEPIASVRQARGDDYEQVARAAHEAFVDWRMRPL